MFGYNLNMIKNTETISHVKETIKNLRENSVEVTLNLGRNKYVRFCGKLSGVYPALFTVTPFDKTFKGKTTYSYSEYMCGRVKLSPMRDAE